MTLPNSPNWQHPDAASSAPQLQRLADFTAGTDAVREHASTYLPKFSAESHEDWQRRAGSAPAPGTLSRTIDASVGRLFAIPPVLDGSGSVVQEWEDIDTAGTHGDVWASRLAALAIRDGLALIVVDAPTAPSDTVPLTDAPAYRPRWLRYTRSQVRNWSTGIVGGKAVLTLLVLDEVEAVPDGAFGMKDEQRRRVFRLTDSGPTVQVWREVTDTQGQRWEPLSEPVLYRGPREIPVAIAYVGKPTAPLVVKPPLLALCDAVQHFWTRQVNIAYYEDLACFPQPTVVGRLSSRGDGADGPAKLELGPNTYVGVEMGGDFKFAELAGSSMRELRENQRERRLEIGALGLSFLVSETRSAETAKAKALDSAAENATLSDAARGIEDALNQALIFHASYTPGATPATVSLNKNLTGETLDAPTMTVLLQMRQAGELTMSEYRELLVRGRVLPQGYADAAVVAEAELEAAVNAAVVGDDDVGVAA
jgi:hypothetical protein